MAPGGSNVQLTIGADWDPPFLKGFGLMGRVIYTSMAYLDAANTQPIPAWTRFDVGARYTLERADGKPITIRANVINLFEMNYWMAPIGVLTQGPPRTFMLSLASEF